MLALRARQGDQAANLLLWRAFEARLEPAVSSCTRATRHGAWPRRDGRPWEQEDLRQEAFLVFSDLTAAWEGTESYVAYMTAHFAWRLRMAECVAAHLDPERFGVKGFYVHGSTKNATAGEDSDINILIHFDGTPKQREHLQNWLEGWSLSLDEANYLRTGHRSVGLLDVQFVTDADIRKRNGYATKINAVTDPARLLPMGTEVVDENRDGE